MKYFNYRLIAISICFLILSCSEGGDDENMQLVPDSYAANFTDSDNNPLSSNARLLNGAVISYKALSNINTTGNPSLFSIMNISNGNVAVTQSVDNHTLTLTTNALTDQEISFDAFYNQKKIGAFSASIKVPFKLIKDGKDVNGEINIDFEKNTMPVEYRLVNIDGTEIPAFDIKNFIFRDLKNKFLDNYNMYQGENFKFIFTATDNIESEFTVSMYYHAKNFNNNSIFIKNVKIKVPILDATNCRIIKEKFVVSNSVGESVNSDFEFLIRNNIIQEFKSRLDTKKVNQVFYKNGKIVEILNSKNGTKKAIYTYKNDLLVHSEVLVYSQQMELHDFYYDNKNNLTAKVVKSVDLITGTSRVTDSIIYEGYANKYPERRIQYLNLNDPDRVYPLYYRVSYDANGNITKEDVSKNDIDFIIAMEQNFDPTEKVVKHLVLSTGTTFKESPVVLSKTFYTDGRGNTRSPSFNALKEIKKDDSGRIIAIEGKYFGNDTVDGEADLLLTFAYETCN